MQLSPRRRKGGEVDAAFTELLDRAKCAPYAFAGVPACDAELSESVVLRILQRRQLTQRIDELVHLCTEASRRMVQRQRPCSAGREWKVSPPLRVEYMADRLDVDDPLRGYLVRHREGGWLQGFLCVTTFTHWQLWFRWDSLAPEAGLARGEGHPPGTVDVDGSLAKKLAALDHAGDPTKEGVIWPRVAEISLLGALGCGSWLIRLMIEELEAGDDYDYVVLQATDTSVGFYERMGFVRVGALARYAQPSGGGGAEQLRESKVVGYRHWTFSDEPMRKMPEPSKMMARRLKHRKAQPRRGAATAQGSMLTALDKLLVTRPPRVRAVPRVTAAQLRAAEQLASAQKLKAAASAAAAHRPKRRQSPAPSARKTKQPRKGAMVVSVPITSSVPRPPPRDRNARRSPRISPKTARAAALGLRRRIV